MSMQPVTPVQPAAPYVGGKLKLAPEIVKVINATEHSSYCECFVGMGGVFLRREYSPPAEIINDRSKDIANFFRVLQRHYVAFMDMLRWQLTSRADFDRLIRTRPEQLTDLERAARFLYLQRTAFGGKVSGRSFGTCQTRPARFDVTKLATLLEEVHTRLSSVVIECLDYKDFIEKYDNETTLFYLDPPYYGAEDFYGKELFVREEFEVMADILAGIKAKFLLSINDHDAIRSAFSRFNIDALSVKYTLAGGDKQRDFGELLISNYKATPMLL